MGKSGYENEINGNKSMTISQYIKWKIKVLQRDFGIALSESDIKHMQSLTNEIQVDNFARTIIFRK